MGIPPGKLYHFMKAGLFSFDFIDTTATRQFDLGLKVIDIMDLSHFKM